MSSDAMKSWVAGIDIDLGGILSALGAHLPRSCCLSCTAGGAEEQESAVERESVFHQQGWEAALGP